MTEEKTQTIPKKDRTSAIIILIGLIICCFPLAPIWLIIKWDSIFGK